MRAVGFSRDRARKRVYAILKYFFLSIIALTNIFPFYWILLSAVKDTNEILVWPLAFPRMFKIENFRAAWIDANLSGYFLNTVIVSAVSVVVIILAAAMAGYILSRVRPNVYLYTFFTLGIMIPVQALIVPIFIIANRIHITNSRLGLTVVYIAVNLSISIFILYGFMKSIPRELEDAAAIDGCTRNRTFFKIILPISMPGLSTTAIFALLTCWNEFLLPLVLITHGANKVLSQGIQDMKGQYITDYGILTAGIVIVTVPVILLYILFQEQVIKGMTAGAIKG